MHNDNSKTIRNKHGILNATQVDDQQQTANATTTQLLTSKITAVISVVDGESVQLTLHWFVTNNHFVICTFSQCKTSSDTFVQQDHITQCLDIALSPFLLLVQFILGLLQQLCC